MGKKLAMIQVFGKILKTIFWSKNLFQVIFGFDELWPFVIFVSPLCKDEKQGLDGMIHYYCESFVTK